MKTKTMVIGSFIIVCLLMVVPSIPALQFKTIVDTNKSHLLEEAKSIDIDALEQKLKNIKNPDVQEKIKLIDFTALKQKINEANAENSIIDIYSILVILMNAAVGVLLGKPSAYRMILNIIAAIILIQELATGVLSPICANEKAYIAATIFTLIGAFLYAISNNKIIGFGLYVILYLIGSYVFYIVQQYLNNTQGHWTTG